MPKVDPTQYLMDALAILTGGLIKDLQTLILGLVVCSFILMALDLLKDLILVPALQSAGNFLADPIGNYRIHQTNKRIAANLASDAPSIRPERHDIEISPLRQHDMELALDGVESLEPGPDATYANNHWENDGVELSEDRYAALESAMDEAMYEERMRHRMSDDDAYDLIHSHAERLRG